MHVLTNPCVWNDLEPQGTAWHCMLFLFIRIFAILKIQTKTFATKRILLTPSASIFGVLIALKELQGGGS